MFELPLFPLNTVLFPGMPLTLHIFEPRYKRMIQLCIQENRPFGVALIEKGREALGPLARPHHIGCTARITHVEPLEDGRMNIIAVGQERFEIVELDRTKPYLVGQVQLRPLQDPNPECLTGPCRALRRRFTRYLNLLNDASVIDFDPANLPDDPVELGYLAATLLQIAPAEKQAFLVTDEAQTLLSDMGEIYQREIAILEALLARRVALDDQAPFSLN